MFKFNESSKDYLINRCLSWEDISWAYEKGLIDILFIEYFTNKNLEEDFSIEIYLNFSAGEVFEVSQRLHELYMDLDSKVIENIKSYWLYLILKYLYINKDNYDDVYSTIEEVYADFDYPEIIEGFIRYMPTISNEVDEKILGTARLQKHWKKYLNDFENLNADILK